MLTNPHTRAPVAASSRARRPLFTLLILLLCAAFVPITSAVAATSTTRVNVWFTPTGTECDVVEPHVRDVTPPRVLGGALEQLFAGPTSAERAAGATSYLFSSRTAGMVRSVAIRDGVAHVDLADLRAVLPKAATPCGATSLLAQLDATVTQFATVQRARYSINGSEATFYGWLGREVPGAGTVTTTRGSLTNTATIRRIDGAAATVRAVRVGRHQGFDRIVFEFAGGRPAYTIRPVTVARRGGSGAAIPVTGASALQIDLQAWTVDHETASYPLTFQPQGPLSPGYPMLRQVRYGGEFEGVSTFAAGLSARTGFRVLELANPTRLAIDVAH